MLTNVKFLPAPGQVAYSCRDGNVGIWDLSRNVATLRLHLEGGADRLAISAATDLLIAAGGSGDLALLDLATGLINYYRGQGFRNVTLVPPTLEYPSIISGDVQGGLRAWPLPARFARMIAETPDRFVSSIIAPHSGAIIATDNYQPTLAVVPLAGEPTLRRIGPHVPDAIYMQLATSGDWFAAYGHTDQVELWSTRTMTRTAVFNTHHDSVSHLQFMDDSNELVTAGDDGNLIRWTFTGESHTVAHFAKPVVVFAVAPATQVTLIGTIDGQLWQIARDGQMTSLPHSSAKALHMLRLPDGVSVCIGFVDGEVDLIDTQSGQRKQLVRAGGAIRDIAVTPDGRVLAVAANDGTVHIGARPHDTWFGPDPTWTTLSARARKIALTEDGLLIAVCTDSIVWLWSSEQRAWLGLASNAAPSTVVVDRKGDTATTLNNQGQIMAIDLQAARRILSHSFRK
jgi:WD40 repeat protein